MHRNSSIYPSTVFYTITTNTSDEGTTAGFKGLDGARANVWVDLTSEALHNPALEMVFTDTGYEWEVESKVIGFAFSFFK